MILLRVGSLLLCYVVCIVRFGPGLTGANLGLTGPGVVMDTSADCLARTLV